MHCKYGSTGRHTRSTATSLCWLQVQVPEVQKRSLWQKPGTHGHSSPKQGDLLSYMLFYLSLLCAVLVCVSFCLSLCDDVRKMMYVAVEKNFPLGDNKVMWHVNTTALKKSRGLIRLQNEWH